jgi:CBS domain-containing protein
MKIRELCGTPVHSVEPTDSIGHAAKVMCENDVGAVPVMKDGALLGIVTDRDLVVRGLAFGMSVHAPVRRVMSLDVISCSPDAELHGALDIMATERVRRLPVRANDGELVGMFALADAARLPSSTREVADALRDICGEATVPCRVPMFA